MEIPRTVNDPIQFLFWSLDEIYPVAVGLIWGIWFDRLLLGMFLVLTNGILLIHCLNRKPAVELSLPFMEANTNSAF